MIFFSRASSVLNDFLWFYDDEKLGDCEGSAIYWVKQIRWEWHNVAAFVWTSWTVYWVYELSSDCKKLTREF